MDGIVVTTNSYSMQTDYRSFPVGNRWLVCPPEMEPHEDSGRLHLIMDRGAFGSGEHETTRSCLELLETLRPKAELKILDLGSGTGILSIAALLLHPGHAWGVDIDAAAIESGRRNCQLNGIGEQVTHLHGTLEQLQVTNFNLILANIYGDILLELAPELVDRTAPGGVMILSGILWEYNFDVRKSYQQLGCKLIRNRLLEEFSTIVLEKER